MTRLSRTSFRLLGLFSLVVFYFHVGNLQAEESGWASLFNGKDLGGWMVVNNPSVSVSNGLLHLEKGKGWLRSEKEYRNFILEVGWRGVEPDYNSGIFVRSGSAGIPYPDGGWQINLKSTELGQLLQGHDKILSSKIDPVSVGQWCTFRVEARDGTLRLYVKDALIWQYDKLVPDRGYIGIQVEGKAMDIQNIRIRELP